MYVLWNDKVNLISRKDIDYLYTKHILHSLSVAKVVPFAKGTRVLDVGTGGGFPGVPLAIMFPEVKFHLVDSIGKKIKALADIVDQLGLENVETYNVRAEELNYKYDFVTCRAVAKMEIIHGWVSNKFNHRSINSLPNGILFLKGGDLEEEIKSSKLKSEVYHIIDYFSDHFFDTKKIIYCRVQV